MSDIDLLREATMMHEVLAKNLWDTKLRTYSLIPYSKNDFGYVEETYI